MRNLRIGIDATALHSRPVGASNYIIQLIRAIARWAGSQPSSSGSNSDGLEFFIIAQRSRLHPLGIQEAPGLHLVTVPDLPPALRLAWEQASLPGLAQHLELDLLHSLHYTMPLGFSGRSVVTFHDMTYFLFPHLHTLPKRYFFRSFIHASSRRAAALLADSESTRQDAIRLVGTPAEKIFTAQLGVTPEFHKMLDQELLHQAHHKYSLPERFILYLGMIEPRKNLPALLHAFAAITGKVPDVHLVVAGPTGWMVDNIHRQAGQLDVSGKVHFTGYIDQADVPLLYNLAEVFTYPSIYEGFGLPVLEAMACGTPVITSNISSMPEIVGDAGMLVPPDNIEALAGSLLALLQDPAARLRLSSAGIARAASFTWDRTAGTTITVYRHVLGLT